MKKIIIPILISALSMPAMAQTMQDVLYLDVYRTTGSTAVSKALTNEDGYAHPVIDLIDKKITLGSTSMNLSRIKEIRFSIKEEELSGIENVTAEQDADVDLNNLNGTPCYNTSGQRVIPSSKGLYIIKGKKYVVR